MKRKALFASVLLVTSTIVFMSCSGGDNSGSALAQQPADAQTTESQPSAQNNLIKDADVQLATPVNQDMVKAGKSIYELKCLACHKLTDEKLVGPGWKGLTERRSPAWIMNMAINPDEMLNTDPEAQKLLEQILVRMPNQNLSKEEARQVLEFIRSNDGVK